MKAGPVMVTGPLMNIDNIDIDSLLHDHERLVWHIIHRTVNDTSVHEDLFQEVFLNVIRSLDRFEGRSKLSTWIASITVRTCYNYLRRLKREEMHYSFERFLEEGGKVPGALEPDPGHVEADDRARTIEQVLNGLPLKYRLPIVLFYLENRSYREIAGVLDIPVGTVKTNLFRGLRLMKKNMGDDRDELL
jgi:RNA polymerase sigma-70 factor (ECF subfamily)